MSECTHPSIQRLSNDDETRSMWACSECRQRFYPACEECVTVGHRDAHERSAGAAPPPGTRLILAHENLLDEWGARTEDGRRITVEWGEPDEHGWYVPTFTKHERSAGAAPLDVLDRIKARIPNPPPHEHEYGCGHNGEGIDPEYQRGWTSGRRYDSEQVRVVLDDLAAEYARLAEGTDE